MEQYFTGLSEDKQRLINSTKLLVYECEGTETEIKKIGSEQINILWRAVERPRNCATPFIRDHLSTLAKEELFSNSQNANILKWSARVSGSVNRQDFLACAAMGE